VNSAFRVLKKQPVEIHISPLEMARLFGAFALQIALYMVGFAAVAIGVIDVPYSLLARLIGAFCLAWVGGFLALFAPAGIGVREGILITVIGGSLSPEHTALIVIAARLWAIAMDVLMAAVAVLILRWSRKSGESRSQ